MDDKEIVESFNSEKDKSLKVQLKKIDNLEQCMIIVLTGYIDTYNSTFFLKRMTTLINNGYINLIFDCKALNYVSSTGIGSFTTLYKSVKEKNGDISLANVQPKVYSVFQLLGFGGFFNVKSSLTAAIQFFQKPHAVAKPNPEQTFPKLFSCPICSKKLRVHSAGAFRCVECKTILFIDKNAHITLK